MSLKVADQLARTIEIQSAIIYLRGEFAGAIEVPIYVGRRDRAHDELEDLLLHVEGEPHLLRPVRREFFSGRLRLMYFSESIRRTRRLPSALQLCWRPIDDYDDSTGMELSFKAASSDSESSE